MSHPVLMDLRPAGVFAYHFGEGTRADDFNFGRRLDLPTQERHRILSFFIDRSDTFHCAHRVPFELDAFKHDDCMALILSIIGELTVPPRALLQLALVKNWVNNDANTYIVATAKTMSGTSSILSPSFVTGCLPAEWSSVVLTVDSEVVLMNHNFRGSGCVTALFDGSQTTFRDLGLEPTVVERKTLLSVRGIELNLRAILDSLTPRGQ